MALAVSIQVFRELFRLPQLGFGLNALGQSRPIPKIR